jgi:hypothetical protein
MSYTSASIKYYRVNAVNAAIATSPSGFGNPTEEITAPLPSPGNFVSYNSGLRTVTGGSGANFNLFAPNQYLYYTDSTGNYVLMGQIESITDADTLILTTAGIVNNPTATPTPTPVLSAAYSLITSNESIYMRIQTNTSSAPANQMLIPNFSSPNWRDGTGRNNPNQSALERISNVGNPLSNATSVEDVPFTFTTQNQFQTSGGTGIAGTTYFPTAGTFPTGSFPAFIWILVTPTIGASTSLSSQTLYRFTTQESTPSISIFVQTPPSRLADAGYNGIITTSGPDQNS